jgi:hypothetical protein
VSTIGAGAGKAVGAKTEIATRKRMKEQKVEIVRDAVVRATEIVMPILWR